MASMAGHSGWKSGSRIARGWFHFCLVIDFSNTFAAAGTQEVNKLYLKLGEHAWWSFQALLDRPSVAAVICSLVQRTRSPLVGRGRYS